MRVHTARLKASSLLLVLFVLCSVSVITANPVARAEITPPPPVSAAQESETVPTTERITTTVAAAGASAITTTVASAMETTQDTSSTSSSASTTLPPAALVPQESETNKEPSQGLVSFDQRQHGRFNIRADLDNFMIILLPQSTTKSPLLNLGGFGGGGSSSGAFGAVPGTSLLDLFTRKVPSKRKGSSYRRKYKVKSASYKRKYKEMLRRQAQEEEEEAAGAAEEKSAAKEVPEQESGPSAEVAEKVHDEAQPLKKLEVDDMPKVEIEERTNYGEHSGIQDKYRMDTLEKIQHQLDILIKRVDAREANFERPPKPANMEHFVEGRTPYRVEIGSLTSDADVLPSPQVPIPFRQFRTDRPLEIGSHGPQPKFFQPWAFPPAPGPANIPMGDNVMNPFAQRGPVMVAFRDGRSLGPRPEGNELRTNSILALPLNSLGFTRAMEMESNEASSYSPTDNSPSLPIAPLPPILETTTGDEEGKPAGTQNPYLGAGFVDLTDSIHSFDSLNVDNVDKIGTPTQTAQFNKDWDLKLLGASDDCGPDRRRDSYGICQFVQF